MICAQFTNNRVEIEIDLSQYNDSVISKVCYWLSEKYVVYRERLSGDICRLSLEDHHQPIDEIRFDSLRQKVSRLLADYKLRDIILQETKDIRNILYVKAFANSDDFEDYNLGS